MYSNTVGLVHHVFLGSARPIYLFGRGSYCSSGDIRDVHIYIYIRKPNQAGKRELLSTVLIYNFLEDDHRVLCYTTGRVRPGILCTG